MIFSDMQNKTNRNLAFLFLHAICFLFNNVDNNLLVFCMGYGMLGVDCSYIIFSWNFLNLLTCKNLKKLYKTMDAIGK